MSGPAIGGEIVTNWIAPANGSWMGSMFWDNGVPMPGVTAIIDNFATFNISMHDLGHCDRLLVRNGNVTFTLSLSSFDPDPAEGFLLLSEFIQVPSLVVGELPGNHASIYVRTGAVPDGTSPATRSNFTELGLAAGSTGEVLVDWSVPLLTEHHLTIGHDGHGELTIIEGGYVENSVGVIALGAGSSGTAIVSGTDSRWNNFGNLAIGRGGAGTLTIDDEAIVACDAAILGQLLGSSGMVELSGVGTRWIMDGTLDVGFVSEGSLTVSGGAVVETRLFATIGTLPGPMIGADEGGVGEVLITGPATVWDIVGDLHVGVAGNHASLTIADGATVLSANGAVGGTFLSHELVITGAGSVWSASGEIEGGPLHVNDGGLLIADTVTATSLHGDGSIDAELIVTELIEPGDPIGTLTVEGDYFQDANARMKIEVAGGGAGESDAMAIHGMTSLGGTLEVQLVNLHVPADGEVVTFLSAEIVTGEFSTIQLPLNTPNATVEYGPDSAVVIFHGPNYHAADFNQDGFVNAADLAVLLGAWSLPPGSPGCPADPDGPCAPDLNHDGQVNAADLAALLGAWTL